jgi:hypothetical protein
MVLGNWHGDNNVKTKGYAISFTTPPASLIFRLHHSIQQVAIANRTSTYSALIETYRAFTMNGSFGSLETICYHPIKL